MDGAQPLTNGSSSLSSLPLLSARMPGWLAGPGARVLDSVSGLPSVRRIHDRTTALMTERSLAFSDAALEALGLSVRVAREDLERIPAEGPLIVVANHPYRRGRGGRAGVGARPGAGGWACRHQAHRALPSCGVCRFETAAHPGRPVLQLVVQHTGAAPSHAARAGRRLPDRVLSRRGVHTTCPQPLRPQHEPLITDSNNIPTT